MAKPKKSKATRHKPNLLGAAARLQKQLERKARESAKKRVKSEAKFKLKFAADPPNICICLQWGKSLVEDDDDILELPSKLSLHNLCGNNIPSPPSTTPQLKFDPSFQNDEDIKYRLMAEWYNAEKNKETDPKSCHRVHNHAHWKYIGTKHAPQIHKGVNEYFGFTLDVFENFKKTVHTALRTSVGDRFGRIGSQFLEVKEFIRKLTDKGIFPTIHASVAKRSMKPVKKKQGMYQTLHEVRFYFDPTDMTPIYAPGFPKGKKQGEV